MGTRQTLGRSFAHAFSGIWHFLRHERNGRIHLLAAVTAIALSVALHISAAEWLVVLLCTGMVFSIEMVNAALETLCNHVQPGIHPAIKIVKDVSAGAVLCAAIISATAGCIIFLPKMMAVLQ